MAIQQPLIEKWTSSDILKALLEKHSGDVAFMPELRIGTGTGGYKEQAIDLWVMEMVPSRGHVKYAYEIKVSRQDFRREIENPIKRKMALLFSDYFYFAAPKGLIPLAELPPECGLIEIERTTEAERVSNYYLRNKNYKLNTVVKAPLLHSMPPNWSFVASIIRRHTKIRT